MYLNVLQAVIIVFIQHFLIKAVFSATGVSAHLSIHLSISPYVFESLLHVSIILYGN
jgi:hypothetical protein